MESSEVLLASVTTDIGVTVIEVTVPFAAVLHAQLVVSANATAKYNQQIQYELLLHHIRIIIDAFFT